VKRNIKRQFDLGLTGLGIAIMSTNRGLMTEKQAREAGIGGEVLCTVF